jgi:hypothetical protein
MKISNYTSFLHTRYNYGFYGFREFDKFNRNSIMHLIFDNIGNTSKSFFLPNRYPITKETNELVDWLISKNYDIEITAGTYRKCTQAETHKLCKTYNNNRNEIFKRNGHKGHDHVNYNNVLISIREGSIPIHCDDCCHVNYNNIMVSIKEDSILEFE